jgi:4-amino-4-deoxy-L-arabinose transferase-like glycosyltransferase
MFWSSLVEPRASPAPPHSAATLLTAGCALLFLPGITAHDLYRTENLRALVADEMLRSGNWVVPTLYGQPHLTKPPAAYAAIALASWPFGEVNEFTARLPSVVAATATVLLFFWLFRRHLGTRGGLVAAVVLPLAALWFDKVPSAEIDALQAAWVSASVLFLLRALEGDGPFRWWLAALLCVAGGFLTKWTAPAFFYAAALPLLWWSGRLRLLLGWKHLTSAALAAAVCLAWAAAAAAQVGWRSFFDIVGQEALQRLSPGHHVEAVRQLTHRPEAGYPWGEVALHPALVLAANLPWSAFALLTFWPGWRWGEGERFLLRAMHCWVWPNLLFWSLVPEHALRHSFPLFPGIAGLAALVWNRWLAGWRVQAAEYLRRPVRNPLGWFAGMVAAAVVLKLVYAFAGLPQRNATRQPRAKGERLAALVPPGRPLFVFHVKDEGILFYYGRRPVRRLATPSELLSPSEPVYCILRESEWRRHWPAGQAEVVWRFRDELGAPSELVRVAPRPKGGRS